MRANDHCRGIKGCKTCRSELLSIINGENSSGWSKTNWFKASLKSNEYDSFKVYIIECWDNEEFFYKIGRTYQTINKRFQGIKNMPYKYKIIQIFEFKELTEENAKLCYDLEVDLKMKNKKHSYLPLIEFGGKYECFTKIIN